MRNGTVRSTERKASVRLVLGNWLVLVNPQAFFTTASNTRRPYTFLKRNDEIFPESIGSLRVFDAAVKRRKECALAVADFDQKTNQLPKTN